MLKRPKITAFILGELREGVSNPQQSCEDRTSEQVRAPNIKENEKYNTKVCVCALFPHGFLFLCQSKTVDRFYIFCFSLLDDY